MRPLLWVRRKMGRSAFEFGFAGQQAERVDTRPMAADYVRAAAKAQGLAVKEYAATQATVEQAGYKARQVERAVANAALEELIVGSAQQ